MGKRPSDEFLRAYGFAMLRWSHLEMNLAAWFRKTAVIQSWDVGYAIFFSARSFAGRADMLNAAIEHVPETDPTRMAFLKEVALKAIAYSGTRNQIAHGIFLPHGDKETLGRGDRFREPGAITIKELETAGENFADLADILFKAHDAFKSSEPPERLQELLARLRRLPNEACSSEPSRKQKGRERQRQAALRKKGNSPKG